jgi:peroxiredoxin 6
LLVHSDFSCETTQGYWKSFHKWKGAKWAVIFSHPADFTPVCTTEIASLQAKYRAFQDMNCAVATLSVDPVTSHQQWIKDVIAHSEDEPITSLDFPIIGDSSRDIATAYGMIDPWTSDRQALPLTIRCVFIINPEHKLMLSMNYPACVGRNMDEIMRCVKALQLSYQKSVATPANWPNNHKKVTLGSGKTTADFQGGVFLLPTVTTKEADEHYPGYHTCAVPSQLPYLRLIKASDVGQLPNDNLDCVGCGIQKSLDGVKRKEKLGKFSWFRGKPGNAHSFREQEFKQCAI